MKIDDVEYECSDCGSNVPAGAKFCINCGANLDEKGNESSEIQISSKGDMDSVTAYIVEEIKKNTANFSIIQKLVEQGMDGSTASQLVEQVYTKVMMIAREESPSAETYLPALLGAVLAALVGGVVWSVVVIVTNYVVGYMAWGMGWLSGFAVREFSNGKKGPPFQVMAVVSSIIGIVIGKYFTFYHFVREYMVKEYGTDAVSAFSISSLKVIKIFFENIGELASGYDVLWIALAIYTAWRIPKGIGLRGNHKL